MTKNLVASIKAKLLNISKKENKDFHNICLQYCQERILYRLSKSKYKDNFILKGGLSLIALDISSNRPTKDIDFLCKKIKNSQIEIREVFKEIFKTNVEEDGLKFDLDSINTQSIAEEALYEGVRVIINTYLDKSIYKIIIDIGFSDNLINKIEEINFPIFLDKFESPKVNIYPLEAIISEKFEAIVKLYEANSRLKDFYDIYFLLKSKNFNISKLNENLFNTFNNRKTLILDRNKIFSNDFKNNEIMSKKWESFLKTNKLNLKIQFKDVVNSIENFINYPFEKNSGYFWNFILEKWEEID